MSFRCEECEGLERDSIDCKVIAYMAEKRRKECARKLMYGSFLLPWSSRGSGVPCVVGVLDSVGQYGGIHIFLTLSHSMWGSLLL